MDRLMKKDILFLFLIIPFFKPLYFQYDSQWQWAENIFVAWKVVAAAVILGILFIYVWNYSRISKIVLWTALFEISILVSTIYNRGYMERALIDGISMISYVSLLYLEIKYNCKRMLRLLNYLMVILLFLNLLSIILFPDGIPADLYGNTENALFFMVIDNGSALFLAFVIVIVVLDGLINMRKITWKKGAVMGACLLSAVLSNSVTAIITVIILLLSVIFVLFSDFTRFQNPKLFMIIYLILILYLFSMQENVVTDFIMTNLFHRTGNFTGRYVLWSAAFNMIRMHPWLGYGRSAQDYIATWGGYYSSHNYILEIMLQGGIIALILFGVVVMAGVGRLYKMRHFKASTCLIFFLMTILIAAMMESAVHSVYIFGIFVFCYYCQKLEASGWEKRNEKRIAERDSSCL